MRGIRALRGLRIARNAHKRRLANIKSHLTVEVAYVDSMYTGLCGAYERAKALGVAPCLALIALIYYEFGEPCDLARSRSSPEATAEEWRFRDEACHAYRPQVSRSFNPTASQNHTVTVLHAAYGPLELVRSRSNFEATAEV